MIERLTALIVDESKWLSASLGLAVLAVTAMLRRARRAGLPVRPSVMGSMSLFFGVTIGAMAFGHLLAVTTRLATGTLAGSVPLFYAIGIVLAVPSWWLVAHAWGVPAAGSGGRTPLVLNAWTAATLLALGLHNLPLAAPGLLNVAYHLHRRRAVGWAIVALAAVVNAGLLVGSLVFLASGLTFEQFRGLE